MQGRRRKGGGAAGACVPPHFQKWGGGGGTSGFYPPPHTFGQTKCSNLAIISYFVVNLNAKYSWLASLANFTLLIFSNLS